MSSYVMRGTVMHLSSNSISTHWEKGSTTPGVALGENEAVNGDSMECLVSL